MWRGAQTVMSLRFPAVALLASLTATTGCVNEPPTELGVWSEFLPYEEVNGHLGTLAEFDVDLYLAVRPTDLDSDEFWNSVEAAKTAGVPVRHWLQLPEQGVWLNEQSIAAFSEFALELLVAAGDHDIPVNWIVFDLEPDFAYAEALWAAAEGGELEELAGLLAWHRDPETYALSLAALGALIEELHARNVEVMAVTLPWTIDDLFDSDADIQDAFDTPLADVPWDQVSVMVYRPVFAQLLGVGMSPGYVRSYALSTRAVFGPNAQVAIGNISTPGVFTPPGYTDPLDVRLDVGAARSAGIGSISLFSLDGMVLEGGPERWLAAASTPTLRFPYLDPLTAVLRAALRWLDSVADSRLTGEGLDLS